MKRRNIYKLFILALMLGLVFAPVSRAGEEPDLKKLPVKGMVTMVDLGAHKCIPCKMMAPIIEEVRKEYKNRAAIVFLDVWQNPKAARHFGIRVIPTQIFYDAKGREVMRHEGFMDKENIELNLKKCGVKPAQG